MVPAQRTISFAAFVVMAGQVTLRLLAVPLTCVCWIGAAVLTPLYAVTTPTAAALGIVTLTGLPMSPAATFSQKTACATLVLKVFVDATSVQLAGGLGIVVL